MVKKLLIGLVIAVFSIFGILGYVMLQTSGNTPSITTIKGNPVPEAALEINTYTSSQREICNECEGTGWSPQIACLKCCGKGVLVCNTCKGTGNDSNGNICPYCHGTGEIICTKCYGTGGTKCKFCAGDGYYNSKKGDKKAI